jgi:hypothetical protein
MDEGLIRIEIEESGRTLTFIGQPRADEDAERMWRLYRELLPGIRRLEQAAKVAAEKVSKAAAPI